MDNEFVTYRKFGTLEEANALIETLKNNGIPYEMEDNSPDTNIISTYGSQEQTEFDIKISPTDFEKADLVLEKDALETVRKLSNDYYLFYFGIPELYEIIDHFDEWNETDYLLAQKILKSKGEKISDEEIKKRKNTRIEELKKPEKAGIQWLMLGYLSAIFGGILGIFIGYYLSQFKKRIPNGEKVFAYDNYSRNSGKIMFVIGIVSTVFWFIIYFLNFDKK
jgi:hypothetical protein